MKIENYEYGFYSRMYLWIYNKVRKAHLAKYKNDIKCTNCNEWYSISGLKYKHEYKSLDFGYSATCGQCGKTTYWNTQIAPVPFLCDENGIPLSNILKSV